MNSGGNRGGGPPAKKFRNEAEDEDEGMSFEERLAMLEDEDQIMGDVPTEVEEAIESQEERFARWRRPTPPPLDVSKDDLIFQQIDIDHYIGKPFPNMKGARSGPVPIVRMFGVTKLGNSVCCHVHGFHPYFYVPAPEKFSKEHIR